MRIQVGTGAAIVLTAILSSPACMPAQVMHVASSAVCFTPSSLYLPSSAAPAQVQLRDQLQALGVRRVGADAGLWHAVQGSGAEELDVM